MEPLYERKTGFGRNTTVCFAWKGGPLLMMRFHSTVVARFDYQQADLDEYRSRTAGGALTVPDRLKPSVAHLNNGGWSTKTTRERIDRALCMVGLGHVHLITRKHQEYICYGGWGYSCYFEEFNGSVSFAGTKPETLPTEGALPWVVKYQMGSQRLVWSRKTNDDELVQETATIVVNTPNKPSALLYARAVHLTNGEKIVGVSKF